jgi:Family of unknown function (DUF6064)
MGSRDTSTLPFTAEVLSSVVQTYNRAVWPAQVVAYVLALALVWIAIRPRYGGYRRVAHSLAGAALAAAWAWTGVAFHFSYFANINFLAPVYGSLFVVQALLLAWTAAVSRQDRCTFAIGPLRLGKGSVS